MPLATWLGSETAALWVEFALFLVPYLIAGYDVLLRAAKNIGHGQVFDENFLMSVATIGAFALVLFPDSDPHMAEGAAVMLFYQVGELFQSYAVGKSRKSIADMMDIAPDFANVERDGRLVQVDPYEVAVGDEIVVKAGERVPLDGVVVARLLAARHRGPHRRVGAARGARGRRDHLGLRQHERPHHRARDQALRRVHREPHPRARGERGREEGQDRELHHPLRALLHPGGRRHRGAAWPSCRRFCWAAAGPTGCSAG